MERERDQEFRIRDRIRELRRVRARDLLPNPKNWRVHPKSQVSAMRALLEEIGYADVIIARELPNGRLMIIDGHLRAKLTPDAEGPVLILDVTEEEADKLLLTLDPLAAMAEADAERIKALLETVQNNCPAVELLLRRTAGDDIWRKIHPLAEPPARIDKAAELRNKWGTQNRQIWRIGGHRLVCGDATNPQHVMRLMGDERAVLFASDPPYVVGYNGGAHPQSWSNARPVERNECSSDSSLEHRTADVRNSEETGIALYRRFIGVAIKHAITRNAAWYIWCASRRHSMVERVWAEFDAFVHQQIIWVKTRAVLTHSVYLWQHEPCLFGWVRGERPRVFRAEVGQVAGQFPTTVWMVPSSEVETNAHPTSKPCKLFALSIEMHTEPGDVCFEAFAGSGSQLVAAEQLGRRCYAVEKSPEFVAVVLERMAALGVKPELVGEA